MVLLHPEAPWALLDRLVLWRPLPRVSPVGRLLAPWALLRPEAQQDRLALLHLLYLERPLLLVDP